ncbi:hypothetical protein KIN20_001267 [Parelaphostrongylus tenuis]|uniref:Uncharacterized protein n=1 Tax=Parelaphostrongylus tenuis TaxID=148309 RepID=A0AAD5MCC4_PARTN|nr:hypothetical protein KIN20_001267 [Parelaphostrongylus tenuis]
MGSSVVCLNNFVDNYETLNYRVVNTARRRRSSGYGEPINLKFHAYNRSFHLSLLPIDEFSDQLFHPDHILDEDGQYEEMNQAQKFMGPFLVVCLKATFDQVMAIHTV